MRRLFFGIVALLLPLLLQGADYKIKAWEKQSIAQNDTLYSADRESLLYAVVGEQQTLHLMPYDSLTIVNVATNRSHIYVNSSDKLKTLTVRDMTRSKLLNVVTGIIGRTVSNDKSNQVEYKMLGGLSRGDIKPDNVDKQHMGIYNTIVRDLGKYVKGDLKTKSEVKLTTDTVDGIIRFHFENDSRNKQHNHLDNRRHGNCLHCAFRVGEVRQQVWEIAQRRNY